MAHYAAKTLGAADFELGSADGARGEVCRWRVYVSVLSGTITVKAKIAGSSSTPIAANVVTTVGATTTGSTITATGIYDIDAAGLSITLSSGTSCTFDAVGVVG